MILLPMEIIDKILYYRETHHVGKMIKNRYDNQRKKIKDFDEYYKFCINDGFSKERLHELDRLYMATCDYPKPHFIIDPSPYDWVIKHPDYNPANYTWGTNHLCRSKMKEKPPKYVF